MRVLLVHGLGRTRLSLLLLGRRLSKSGHTPEFFSYSPLIQAHDRILSRLVRRLRSIAEEGEEVGLVGHSFGGLLLREGLAAVPELRVRHLIFLATPSQQPRLAVRIYSRLPFRVLRGSCGQRLADSSWFRSLPMPSIPYTVVAGTRGWPGRSWPFNGEPNDGVVAVSETIMNNSDQPVLVSAIHTFIMNSRSVHRLIADRLASG